MTNSNCCCSAGCLEPSLEDYNTILQLEPGNVDALYYRGTVYEKLGRLDEAISDFSAVLTLDPNHIKASYARGACRNLKGDFQKAIGKLGSCVHYPTKPVCTAKHMLPTMHAMLVCWHPCAVDAQ